MDDSAATYAEAVTGLTAERDQLVSAVLDKFGKVAAAYKAADLMLEAMGGFLFGVEALLDPEAHVEEFAEFDGSETWGNAESAALTTACINGIQLGADIHRLRLIMADDEVWPVLSRATPYPTKRRGCDCYCNEVLGSCMTAYMSVTYVVDELSPQEPHRDHLTGEDISDHYEAIHKELERFVDLDTHRMRSDIYKEAERAGVDMLGLRHHEKGADPGACHVRLYSLSELPTVAIGLSSATVVFGAKTYDVDVKAARALKAICDAYPVPIGLTAICGDKAHRVVSKLPDDLRHCVHSVKGNKGYMFGAPKSQNGAQNHD